ncbi:ornithine carbamoyltransferase, mitochondrial-like isoform X1 [Nilaparvata lugens]|uniref:ornithine carbamoyltransferase, mitochondrial-like isoform X1 n=1 Tax=Nilaparvata lugens TaxID=108931 RepID=UPI00193D581C|nr:ornithine carbamoyltransferase, mitochondrial-like isoform X1 [Nilaparvata lugens]
MVISPERKNLFNAMIMEADQLIKVMDNVKVLKSLELCKLPKVLNGKKVTIISENDAKNCVPQVALWSVTQSLGGEIMPITFDWHNLTSKKDFGKMISRCYDLVLVETKHCRDIITFSEGCEIPVVYCGCGMYQPLEGLANILTIGEHFGRLSHLKFGWVGPGCSALNTYMMMLPRFGIPISYNCTSNPNFPVQPICYDKSYTLSRMHSTNLNNCKTAKEAIKNSDIIATTVHNIQCQQITTEVRSVN